MAKCTPFSQANRVMTAPQGVTELLGLPIGSLPLFREGEFNISRWKLTWRERLSVLFFGTAWVWVASGDKHPPISLTCNRTIFND